MSHVTLSDVKKSDNCALLLSSNRRQIRCTRNSCMRTGLDFLFFKLSLEGWRVVVILAKLTHRVSTVKRGVVVGAWGVGGGGGGSLFIKCEMYTIYLFFTVSEV